MRSIAIIGLSVFVGPHISRTRVEISQRSFYTSYPQPWLDFSLTTLRCTFSSLADIMLSYNGHRVPWVACVDLLRKQS